MQMTIFICFLSKWEANESGRVGRFVLFPSFLSFSRAPFLFFFTTTFSFLSSFESSLDRLIRSNETNQQARFPKVRSKDWYRRID